MMDHIKKGRLGEELAVKYLLDKGYLILERNYQIGKLELDIIACKDSILYIVEVKSDFCKSDESPVLRIDAKKINHLYRAGFGYLREHGDWESFELLGLAVNVNLELKKARIEMFNLGLT